jgi:hypothetical protein
VPLSLRILADRSILPDAVIVDDPPADQLRALRREIAGHRRTIDLILGLGEAPDPIADLRAQVRTRA